MFKSTTIRSALALSGLLLALSGQPSPAQTSRALAAAGKPGQTNVIIGQAATVASSVHYQAQRFLSCSGGSTECSGDFPVVGANHRLNLTRISCIIAANGGSTYEQGQARLQNASNVTVLREFLPVDFASSDAAFTVNQPIDMQVAANQHLQVDFVMTPGSVATASVCTATGTLETLQ
jgi:hypothetical protein